LNPVAAEFKAIPGELLAFTAPTTLGYALDYPFSLSCDVDGTSTSLIGDEMNSY
jgi:hypothetical protein